MQKLARHGSGIIASVRTYVWLVQKLVVADTNN